MYVQNLSFNELSLAEIIYPVPSVRGNILMSAEPPIRAELYLNLDCLFMKNS